MGDALTTGCTDPASCDCCCCCDCFRSGCFSESPSIATSGLAGSWGFLQRTQNRRNYTWPARMCWCTTVANLLRLHSQPHTAHSEHPRSPIRCTTTTTTASTRLWIVRAAGCRPKQRELCSSAPPSSASTEEKLYHCAYHH